MGIGFPPFNPLSLCLLATVRWAASSMTSSQHSLCCHRPTAMWPSNQGLKSRPKSKPLLSILLSCLSQVLCHRNGQSDTKLRNTDTTCYDANLDNTVTIDLASNHEYLNFLKTFCLFLRIFSLWCSSPIISKPGDSLQVQTLTFQGWKTVRILITGFPCF